MAEDELRMLIHLAVSSAQAEQKINARLDKLEQNVEVLHRNNATVTALLNDMLEQGRADNAFAERLLTLEAKVLALSNNLTAAL